MSPRSFLAAAGVAALATSLAASSSSPFSAPLAVDAPVHTVRIDAVAVDARGRAVSTLTPPDFELREAGKLLPVDEAPFMANTPRVIAIYVDEYHISPGASADRAREALARFVEEELQPGDSIVVMKPLDSLLSIRLTTDHATELAKIATLEGRSGDLAPRTDYERTSMVGSPQRVQNLRTQISISALNALAVQLGTVNSYRKTLLVVSERLGQLPGRRGQEHLATVDSLVRSANRANVSIYPIDPRPQPLEGAEPDAILAEVARDTAGRVVAGVPGSDDLTAGIRAAAAEAGAYYMLSYRSAHEEDGSFHPVEVRTKRRGVQVRARSGYWAPSADDRLRADIVARANRPPDVVPLEPAQRSSPLIRPWFGLSIGQDDRMRVTFVWEPAPTVPGDPVRTTASRVELTVLGQADAVVFEGSVLPVGPALSSADAGSASAVFEAPPGRLKLRMNILDEEQRRVDSDVRDLIIRDLRGKVAIGTPEVLRARNAREYRALIADPEAPPVSSRQFSRREHLLIRFPAYAPDGTPTVAARLLNRLGQPMRTLDVRASAAGVYELDVVLSGLASGDYHIELEATSAAGRVTERLDFRVTT